jgi:hypothetical protein
MNPSLKARAAFFSIPFFAPLIHSGQEKKNARPAIARDSVITYFTMHFAGALAAFDGVRGFFFPL